jgi:hypothetical protein
MKADSYLIQQLSFFFLVFVGERRENVMNNLPKIDPDAVAIVRRNYGRVDWNCALLFPARKHIKQRFKLNVTTISIPNDLLFILQFHVDRFFLSNLLIQMPSLKEVQTSNWFYPSNPCEK